MGRRKKDEEPGIEKAKTATIIDFINYLTVDKKKWSDLTEADKKAFMPFILNRWLSMDPYFLEAINQLQKYTIGMDKDKVWRIYYELLPKDKVWIKYVKAKEIEGVPEEDLNLLQKHFKICESDSVSYYKILKQTEEGRKELELIKYSYLGNEKKNTKSRQ